MEDEVFIAKLNQISQEHKLKLPVIKPGVDPPSEDISEWAEFFELCIKKGISLGDSRWSRVAIKRTSPRTKFTLEGGCSTPPDTDFRVGLQLLLGLFDEPRGDEENSAI